ncbi:MAG: hypothetical protein A2Y12_09115 [Planctomycetes bacterium GWF2_42_9]|nr:MAG: hypothetical protein A2Y12_09115 [Planctomycetes bacterium GWF2_42_9]
MNKKRIWTVCLITLTAFAAQYCEGKNISIVPEPREYKTLDLPDFAIDADTTVFYDGNCPVETYAAKHLKKSIKKHYNLNLSLANDLNGANKNTDGTKIILGVTENPLIKEFCKNNKIEINMELPGYDGFIIKNAQYKSSNIIIVLGANQRGVTYGTSVLFDLMKIKNEKLRCPAVYIRDWATIKWRGRPTEYVSLQTEDSLDTCVHSRINFIDIRDTNAPGGWAFCGSPAGVPIDKPKIKKVIDNAHARGIFVFGTVSCSVPEEKSEDVLKTFQEFIDVKADGLWASFDDMGPGKDSPKLIEQIIKFAQDNNITPDKIAITPPSGSYQEIDTVWNKQVVAVPQAEKMKWFFTRIPNKFDDDMMKKFGFESQLCWWHNWPRPKGGILNDFAGGRPLYDSKWAYYELLPLSAGWNNPSDQELLAAANYTDTVMLWQSRPADYDCHVLGLWAWNPQSHDFNAVSQTAYCYVFGKTAAPAVTLFDKKLSKVKTYFTTPLYKNVNPSLWPPRLLDVNDRPTVMEIFNEMDLLMQVIEQSAPKQSMLSNGNLKIDYLQPMRDIVRYGKKMTMLDYPEYTFKDFPDRMLALADQNNMECIKSEIKKIKADVEKQCRKISNDLTGLKYIDVYVKQWTDYVSDSDYWIAEYKKLQAQKTEAEQKRQEAKEKFEKAVKGDFSDLFKSQNKPADGKVLLEISSQTIHKGRYHARGIWAMGMFEDKAVAIASLPQENYKESDMAMLSTEVTIPNFTKRLYLEVYIAHIAKDSQTPPREDIRVSALRIDNKTIWNQDLNVPLKGWQINDITDVAKSGDKVTIRFLVSNRVIPEGYDTIVFFGPARLVER